MIYDLSSEIDRQRFKIRCNSLLKNEKIVDLSEKRKKRTFQQNRYLHLILGWFSVETGNTIDYVKHNYFKLLCNKEIFVKEVEDKYLGKIEYILSSKNLDTLQMTIAIERFRSWSASVGIYLPEANEDKFLQFIEIELQRNIYA